MDPRLFLDDVRHFSDEPENIGGRGAAEVDDDVGMLARDLGAADAGSLETLLFDDSSGVAERM